MKAKRHSICLALNSLTYNLCGTFDAQVAAGSAPRQILPLKVVYPIMTATVERIKQQIRSLASDEAEELLRDLQHEYPNQASSDDEADSASIEAEWDAEIDVRVKEIEEGTVQLLTAEESERRSDAVFARLGIPRPVYRP